MVFFNNVFFGQVVKSNVNYDDYGKGIKVMIYFVGSVQMVIVVFINEGKQQLC